MRIGVYEIVGAFCAAAVAWYAYPLLDPSCQWEFMLIWDDDVNFLETTAYRGLSWSNLYEMATLTAINVFEPFGWLFKALVYEVAGLNARAYRIATLLVHLAAAWVLARTSVLVIDIYHGGLLLAHKFQASSSRQNGRNVVETSGRYTLGCMFSALLLFVLHPMNVEVVAWPSAQPYAVAALFSMLALFFHCSSLHRRIVCELSQSPPRAARGASPETEKSPSEWQRLGCLVAPSLADRDTQLSAGCFIAAVLSKSVCVLLPIAAVLIDLLVLLPTISSIRSRSSGNDSPTPAQCGRLFMSYAWSKVPLSSVAIVFVVVTLLANTEGAGQHADVLTLTGSERLLKALVTPAWIVCHFVWPVGLRPHYQLRDDELNLFTNNECLLSVAALAFTVWWLLFRDPRRGSASTETEDSRHAGWLAFAYFCCMVLPTCGLIQHGVVAMSADRYAYFPTMVFVPIGGYWLTHWLQLRGEEDGDLLRSLLDRGSSATGSTTSTSDQQPLGRKHFPGQQQLQRSPRSSGNNSNNHTAQRPTHARVAYAVVVTVFVFISTKQMAMWQTSTGLMDLSIQIDPTDWRMYDNQMQYKLKFVPTGCGDDFEDCKNAMNLAYHFAPSKSLKAKLYRNMVLYVLGRRDSVCASYQTLLEQYPANAIVLNNVAFCLFGAENHVEARKYFKAAQHAPGMTDRERRTTADNFFAYEEWSAAVAKADGSHVPFHAKLMW